MVRALVDGDILVYRCGFAAEGTHYTVVDKETGYPIYECDSAAEYKQWVAENVEDPDSVEIQRERTVEPKSHALANVRSVMDRIFEAVSPDSYDVYLTEGRCFRDEVATLQGYKDNRKDAPRPVYYDDIRDYLQKQYGAVMCAGVEADDVLAIEQGEDTVIVSIDKDLLQVPGKHYNWVNDEKILVTPEVGLRKKWLQVLTGDPTDNIPGIKGVGPKTARKILADVPDDEAALKAAVIEAYEGWLSSGKAPDEWAEKGAEALVEEIHDLIEVGGERAKSVLERQGGQVHAAGQEEGQAASAA